MNNDKIDKLEELLVDTLHPFSTTVVKKIERKVVYCEITLKFRSEDELDKLIGSLKALK